MQQYKVTGMFELVVNAYSEEHVKDLIESMISENPQTKEIFNLHVETIQAVKQ